MSSLPAPSSLGHVVVGAAPSASSGFASPSALTSVDENLCTSKYRTDTGYSTIEKKLESSNKKFHGSLCGASQSRRQIYNIPLTDVDVKQ